MSSVDLRVEAAATHLFEALGTDRQFNASDERFAGLDLAAAYRVTARVAALRAARGERMIGRKIGFTNEEVWGKRGFEPMWGYVYDTSVRLLPHGAGALALDGFAEPRIEPEVVLRLRSAPRADMNDVELMGTIEWVALGFEIVQSRFPNWVFTEPEAVAAYALHAFLLVGEPCPVAGHATERWLASLASLQVNLIGDGRLVDVGYARNVLGGPLTALRRLLQILQADTVNPPVAAGEIITTGTLSIVPPIKTGERWSTEGVGTGLGSVSVAFT